jgi:hypothetical protein
MKTTYFLLAVVSLGALTFGIAFADPPSNQPSGQSSNQNHPNSDYPAKATHDNQVPSTGNQSDEHGNRTLANKDQTDEKHSPSNADSHTHEKISQAGPTKTPPKHPSANNSSQPTPALNKAAAVAKNGLPVNKPASVSVQQIKPPVGGGTAVPGPNIFRKQAGPTASLGGLAASSIKTSTAGINGTGMKRTTFR